MNELRKFRIAIGCLWAAIALLAASVLALRESIGLGLDLFYGLSIGILAIPFLLLMGLCWMISRRANWARITYLVVFIFWLFPSSVMKSLPIFLIFTDVDYFLNGGLYMTSAGLSLISFILHVVALYLFFSCHTSTLFQKPHEIADVR